MLKSLESSSCLELADHHLWSFCYVSPSARVFDLLLQGYGFPVSQLFDMLLEMREQYGEILLKRWNFTFRYPPIRGSGRPVGNRSLVRRSHCVCRATAHSHNTRMWEMWSWFWSFMSNKRGSVFKRRPEHSLPFGMGSTLKRFVCVWAQRAIVCLCSMIPEGRGAVRTDKQTHTPSFLLFFLLEWTHTNTLGKPQECYVVLLGSDPSPVHLLSMERWNVRFAERQTDVGGVERRQGGKKTSSVRTTPNGTVGG